jgi:hypothetical protein
MEIWETVYSYSFVSADSSILLYYAMSIGKYLFTHVPKTQFFRTELFNIQRSVTFNKSYVIKWKLA